ncbi:MAG: alkaline phosphatase [Bacteroidota bacterium]
MSCKSKKPKIPVTPKGAIVTPMEKVTEVFPKNIILMIGDGMGLAQITASMYLNKKGSNLEKFPVVGLQKTFAGDNLVTDSAAGATAIACGVKTYVNAIGVDMDTVPVKSILELAEENGLATGLLVTSSIVHGTPGPFYAHVEHREFKEDIAADLLDVEIDFIVGGGKVFFENRQKDERDLYKELKKKGYYVSDYFKQDILEMNISSRKNFAFFTSYEDRPPSAMAGREYLPYLAYKGPRFLKKRSENGFFMMIEGSQIDWGGHSNDPEILIAEMDDFNKAVGNVLKFAKRDRETLVIVTADHECGGFSINNGSTREALITAFTGNGHTADMVPVFAYGPQSKLFHGIYDNTDIFKKMKQALRLESIEDKKEN